MGCIPRMHETRGSVPNATKQTWSMYFFFHECVCLCLLAFSTPLNFLAKADHGILVKGTVLNRVLTVKSPRYGGKRNSLESSDSICVARASTTRV